MIDELIGPTMLEWMLEYGWDVVELVGTKLTVALVAPGEILRGLFIGYYRFSNENADHADKSREGRGVEGYRHEGCTCRVRRGTRTGQ